VPDVTAEPTAPDHRWHPPQSVLEIAELVLTGALPVAPAIVEVPDEIAGRLAAGGAIEIEDAEGTPVAGLTQAVAGGGEDGTEPLVLPEFTPRRPFTHGPVRAARRTPAQVREALASGPAGRPALERASGQDLGLVLAVPVTTLLTAGQVEEIRADAQQAGATLLWMAVFGSGRTLPLPADGLWRAVRDLATGPLVTRPHPTEPLAAELRAAEPRTAEPLATGSHAAEPGAADPRAEAVPVGVPLLDHTEDAALLTAVARGYGATEVITVPPAEPGELHPSFAREFARAVPPPHRRGVTVFFTGLSGSGKSTVAKALGERLLDHSTRTVSLLDGDEVRRMLSAGLTFSRADRDLNIRRVGFVAAEITRHGGLAICAPIAPFESVRAEVRAEVEQVGDFVLVHISTPLEECERRDRKGLYAKARRGEIPDFTGISSPYDVPADPELRIDTTGITIDAAVDQVWALLSARGYLTGPEKD
jgi:sulfate adenylyltransferase